MKKLPATIRWIVLSIIGLLLLVSLFDPADSSRREVPPEEVCKGHIESLGKAIAKYEAEKGPLPQSIKDPSGFEHSWRVAIIPYLGWELDNPDYRWDEPWDSTHNQEVLYDWRGGFFCSVESRSSKLDHPFDFTSYLMLVRNQSSDSDKKPLSDKAVILVESTGCQIRFAEPKDLNMEDLFASDSPFGVGKLNSPHQGVVRALRADGTVIDIPKNLSKERLRRLLDGNLTIRDKVALNISLVIGIVFVLAFILLLAAFWYLRFRRKRRIQSVECFF